MSSDARSHDLVHLSRDPFNGAPHCRFHPFHGITEHRERITVAEDGATPSSLGQRVERDLP